MDGEGQRVADAEDSAKSLGPETQMGDLAEVFEAGPVLQLQRVVFGVAFAKELDGAGFYFYSLAFSQGSDQGSGDFQGGAGSYLFQPFFVACTQFHDDLQVIIGGAVVQGDELIISETANPTHNDNFL